MIELLQKTGVRVYTLDTPVAVNGYHEFGNGDAGGDAAVSVRRRRRCPPGRCGSRWTRA